MIATGKENGIYKLNPVEDKWKAVVISNECRARVRKACSLIKAAEHMDKISGKQHLNNQKDSLNEESHSDGAVLSGKELKDGKLLTLTQKAEVLSQYFCLYLALWCVLQQETNIFHAVTH